MPARPRAARRPYTYFIFLTALAHKNAILEGMQGGADDYLAKPLDLDELRARLIAAERVTELHHRLAEQAQSLEQPNQKLFEMARTDPLTGLGNRLQMLETLTVLQARAERYNNSYAIAMCDLDRFKGYNDTLGHVAGDSVLRRVADILRQTTRDTDSVYRYGGEELLILLPEQTLASAELAGERIRRAVAGAAIVHPGNAPFGIVTISIGIAAFDQTAGRSFDTVIAEADAALYEAKGTGRQPGRHRADACQRLSRQRPILRGGVSPMMRSLRGLRAEARYGSGCGSLTIRIWLLSPALTLFPN